MHLQGIRLGTALLVLLVGLHLAAPSAALAARFLDVKVERDGVVVLQSGFGAGDYDGRERLWGRLKDVDLAEVGAAPLAAGNQEVTLEGDLRITIRHVDRDLVNLQLDRLTLRRTAAGRSTWRLPREEVERAAIRGGLDVTQLYPPERSGWGLVMTVAAIASGGLIALAIWLAALWLLRRRGSRQPTAV